MCACAHGICQCDRVCQTPFAARKVASASTTITTPIQGK